MIISSNTICTISDTAHVERGYLYGINANGITINGTGVATNIFLVDAYTMQIMYMTTSTNTGTYIFTGVDLNYEYSLIAVDTSNTYNSKIHSNVQVYNDKLLSEQRDMWIDMTNNIISLYNNSYPIMLDVLHTNTVISFAGNDNISGFIEGKQVFDSTIKFGFVSNIITQEISSIDYNINNINFDALSYIEYDNKKQLFNIEYHTNMKKGYITGSVNNSCDGTDFKIRVYREDGFFIGDYDIAENGSYEIPNLNVHSSYDVLLYDLNLAVETQVNSRRVPTAYSVSE